MSKFNRENIEKEFNEQITSLRESIERIGLRQDELKSYIFDLTSLIEQSKQILMTLPKDAYESKIKFQISIQKNSELVAKFYDCISSFESIRQRYQQDIGKITKDKVYLLNIEIQKIQDKFEGSNTSLITFMKELRSLVSSAVGEPEVKTKLFESLKDHPEYNLE